MTKTIAELQLALDRAYVKQCRREARELLRGPAPTNQKQIDAECAEMLRRTR